MKKYVFWTIICFLTVKVGYSGGKETNITLIKHTEIAVCGSDSTQSVALGSVKTGFFNNIFDTSLWPARWQCGVWSDFHGWLYISSDFLIWAAYFIIPLILGYFLHRKRSEVPFRSIFLLFIGFILACGLTHLIDAAIFWWPAYKLSAILRFGTALVSWGTVFALVKVVPIAMEFKSPEKLQDAVAKKTAELQALNQKLQDREDKIQKMNESLEKKVRERTQELKKNNIELMAINKELESFCSSISHDLRSPLRTVHGFTQVLSEDYKDLIDDKGQEYMSKISSGTIRMGQLIDDLLFLSRVTRSEIDRKEIDMSKLAKKMFDKLSNGNVTVEIEDNLRANGDYRLIKAALECLIGNAIKYSGNNTNALIQIGMQKQGNQPVFFIKDNGVGFDMKYAHKLFTPFQKLHHPTDFEGNGVGLATVKRIMLKHGGDIWVEAKEDEGATFYFTF